MTIYSIPPDEFRAVEVFICEFLGCAVMMCFGCMAFYANAERYADVPPMQDGFAWGFIVCTISLMIGYVSGAQCNPCVTLCFVILGQMSLLEALVYVSAQFLGCLLGMGLAVVLTPEALYRDYKAHAQCGFCTTHPLPGLNLGQLFFLEFWSTFFFILCVCGASDPRTESAKEMKPFRFAFLITMLVLVVGPFTGAGLNPFRTLAPAVFSNCWDDHYMYWCGPLGGSAAATLLYKYVLQQRKRPSPAEPLDVEYHDLQPLPLNQTGNTDSNER